jgi:membrane-bound lytic murein transglycosylase D
MFTRRQLLDFSIAAGVLLVAGACVSSAPRVRGAPPPEVPAWFTAPAAPAPAPSAPGGADIPVGRLAEEAVDTVRKPPPAHAAFTVDSAVSAKATVDSAVAILSTAVAPAPVLWDMEVEEHAERTRVAYFTNIFSGRSRETFQRALSRQTRFAPMISDRLRAAGLPQDLTYLALIESYYDPHAYSKAAAVGMWQFMTRTAKGVGLRVDWWVDERRDPVRATEGAVKLLSSLHDEFGSLFLAAAAYNGGSGRVSRGLTQFARRLEDAEGEDKFFALADTRSALRPETRDYVPKMIAAALVAKQPERYGLQVDSLIPMAFDSVLAPGGAPLAAIAKAVDAPVDTVRDLNSHLLRGMVPAGEAMWVRVPVGSAEIFESAYAALDSADRAALRKVVSKKGESMASIARRHKLTAKQLNWYNPKVARLKSGNLVTGQTIHVPTLDVAAAARDVPNPAIERYPRRTVRRPPARTAAAAKAPTKRP